MKKSLFSLALVLCVALSTFLPVAQGAAPGSALINKGAMTYVIPGCLGETVVVPVTITGEAPERVELYNYYTTKAGSTVRQLLSSSASAPFTTSFKATRASYSLGVCAYYEGGETFEALESSARFDYEVTATTRKDIWSNDFNDLANQDKGVYISAGGTNSPPAFIETPVASGNYAAANWYGNLGGVTGEHHLLLPDSVLQPIRKSNTELFYFSTDITVEGNLSAHWFPASFDFNDIPGMPWGGGAVNGRANVSPFVFNGNGQLELMGSTSMNYWQVDIPYHLEVVFNFKTLWGTVYAYGGVEGMPGYVNAKCDFYFGNANVGGYTTLADASDFRINFIRFNGGIQANATLADRYLFDNFILRTYNKISDPMTIIQADLPYVNITSPSQNGSVNTDDGLTIKTNVSDDVKKVEYYNNGELLGTASSAPFSYTDSDPADGAYSVTAKAYDANNKLIAETASPIKFIVETWIKFIDEDFNTISAADLRAGTTGVSSGRWSNPVEPDVDSYEWPLGWMDASNQSDRAAYLTSDPRSANNLSCLNFTGETFVNAGKINVSFDFKLDNLKWEKGWDAPGGGFAIGHYAGTANTGKINLNGTLADIKTDTVYSYSCQYNWQEWKYDVSIIEKATGAVIVSFNDFPNSANSGVKPTTGNINMRWTQNGGVTWTNPPITYDVQHTLIDNMKIYYTNMAPAVSEGPIGVEATASEITLSFEEAVWVDGTSGILLSNVDDGNSNVPYASIEGNVSAYWGDIYTITLNQTLEPFTTYRLTFTSVDPAPADAYIEFATNASGEYNTGSEGGGEVTPPTADFKVASLLYTVNGKSVNSLSGVNPGDDIVIYPNISNKGLTAKNAFSFIIAIYNNGILTNIGVESFSVGAESELFGSSDFVEFSASKAITAGDEIKVFVWDDTNSLKPLIPNTPF